MVELESRAIKIAEANSIRNSKSKHLFSFLHAGASQWRHQEDSFANELTC